MFYFVPLGNPGEKYQTMRHNIGWLAMDACIEAWQLPRLIESKQYQGNVTEGSVHTQPVMVLYPDTFMNLSGKAVGKLVPRTEAERLVVLHDDIDVPLGKIKIGFGRGPGGNNGVKSIIETLGTKAFVRVRIGIAPTSFWTGKIKRPAGGGPLERFVLQPFKRSEAEQLPDIFGQVQGALELIVTDGVEAAMNRYN